MPVTRRKVRRVHPHRRRLSSRRSFAHRHGCQVYETRSIWSSQNRRLLPQAAKGSPGQSPNTRRCSEGPAYSPVVGCFIQRETRRQDATTNNGVWQHKCITPDASGLMWTIVARKAARRQGGLLFAPPNLGGLDGRGRLAGEPLRTERYKKRAGGARTPAGPDNPWWKAPPGSSLSLERRDPTTGLPRTGGSRERPQGRPPPRRPVRPPRRLLHPVHNPAHRAPQEDGPPAPGRVRRALRSHPRARAAPAALPHHRGR